MVYTATFKGVVSSGLDVTGVFGVSGADLAGSEFMAVYTVDTDGPGARTEFTDYDSLLGAPCTLTRTQRSPRRSS